MLSDPHAQDIFPAVHRDTQDHIGRFGDIPVILLDLVMDGVHEYEGVHVLQRPALPCRHFRGDFHIVQLFDLLRYIPLAHPAGVQRQDLFFHPIRVPVIFADDLRLIGPITVTGHTDLHLAKLGLHCLSGVAVAVVPGLILRHLRTLAAFPAQFFVHLHFHHLLDHIPEHLLHGLHDLRCAGKVLALDVLFQ